MTRRKDHLQLVDDDPAAVVYGQAEEIFEKHKDVFAGYGIKVVNPSDCARSLLFREGQSQNKVLLEALCEVLREALRERKIVAEHGHYRLVHMRKNPAASKKRNLGDLYTV